MLALHKTGHGKHTRLWHATFIHKHRTTQLCVKHAMVGCKIYYSTVMIHTNDAKHHRTVQSCITCCMTRQQQPAQGRHMKRTITDMETIFPTSGSNCFKDVISIVMFKDVISFKEMISIVCGGGGWYAPALLLLLMLSRVPHLPTDLPKECLSV
jgi:hypothetical protein